MRARSLSWAGLRGGGGEGGLRRLKRRREMARRGNSREVRVRRWELRCALRKV